MKKLFPLIIIFFVLFLQCRAISFLHLFPIREFFSSQEEEIVWEDHFETAYSKAVKEKKPLFIYFTKKGSLWCEKMEKEILENRDFCRELHRLCIFVRVPIEKAQNEMAFFRVESLPAVILLDGQKKRSFSLGYLPLLGRKYAETVKQILAEYFVSQEGVNIAQNSSILLERYADFLQKESFDSPSVIALRKEVENLDPQNHFGLHFHLALLEFQALSNKNDAEVAIAPLLHYMEIFGKKEKEQLWLLHMTIAQFFLQKSDFKKALFHARASYRLAPLAVKKELMESIQQLKNQIAATAIEEQ